MATEGEVIDLIYALVRCEKPDTVVETGTYHGHGTQAIANALVKNGKGHLWTVENDPALQYVQHPQITYVTADSVAWSADQAPDYIDLAFVDCGPPEIRVQVAANLYPRLRPNGLMLVHDTEFYTSAFVETIIETAGKPALHMPTLNGITLWRKQ